MFVSILYLFIFKYVVFTDFLTSFWIVTVFLCTEAFLSATLPKEQKGAIWFKVTANKSKWTTRTGNFKLKNSNTFQIYRLRIKAIVAQHRHIMQIFDQQFIKIKVIKWYWKYTHCFLTKLNWCRIIKQLELLFCLFLFLLQ